MKKDSIFLFILFSIVSQFAKCQVKKVLLSKDLKVPVSFAEISNLTSGFLTYSNQNGEFFIPKNLYNDEFKVTADFYETKSLKLISDTIFLKEKQSILPELIISGGEAKFESFGYSGKKAIGSFLGSQTLVVKFKNLPLDAVISQINLRINRKRSRHSLFPDQLLVKLILKYSGEDGKPSEIDILPFTISKTINYQSQNLSFDVSHLNLKIQQDEIFCGLQFLGYFKNGVFVDFKDSQDFNKILYSIPFSVHTQKIESWIKDNSGNWIPFNYNNSNCQFNFSVDLLIR
ncbi:MAG: hypothetical protein MUF68_02000 [Cyclobacteriaceae bacterium]|jgi:hypothetical protein|nr:hypothetical protein [Cyclobacteriaceae bacterium]